MAKLGSGKQAAKTVRQRDKLRLGLPQANPGKKLRKARPYRPTTFYGLCLQNLQRLKAHYHRLSTGYLRKLAKLAISHRGDAKELFLGSLESRLDAVLARAGLFRSPGQAAQAVSHQHVTVNGARVNVRSMGLKPGDKVEVREGLAVPGEGVRPLPYLEMEARGFVFLRQPKPSELSYLLPIDFNKVFSALV